MKQNFGPFLGMAGHGHRLSRIFANDCRPLTDSPIGEETIDNIGVGCSEVLGNRTLISREHDQRAVGRIRKGTTYE
ncbi:MAG: hypothetical protein ACR2PG_07990 [Hyphomicrobiaceae bacterium]